MPNNAVARPIDLGRALPPNTRPLQAAPELDDIAVWEGINDLLLFLNATWTLAGHTLQVRQSAFQILLVAHLCANALAQRLMRDVIQQVGQADAAFTIEVLLAAVKDRFFGKAYRTYHANVLHSQAPYQGRQLLSHYLRELYTKMTRAGATDEDMRGTIVRLLSGSSMDRWHSYISRSNVTHMGEAILAMENEERFKAANTVPGMPTRMVPPTAPAGINTVGGNSSPPTAPCTLPNHLGHTNSQCFTQHP